MSHTSEPFFFVIAKALIFVHRRAHCGPTAYCVYGKMHNTMLGKMARCMSLTRSLSPSPFLSFTPSTWLAKRHLTLSAKKNCVCPTGLSAAGSLMYALLDRALHHGSWKAFATRSCNASRFLIAVRSFLCNDSVRFSACFCTFFKSSLNIFILPFKALNLRR